MVLQTTRLCLRELTDVPGDVAFILALLNDPDFLTHIGDRGVRTTEQAAIYLRDRVIELDRGRVAFDGTPAERRAQRVSSSSTGA